MPVISWSIGLSIINLMASSVAYGLKEVYFQVEEFPENTIDV